MNIITTMLATASALVVTGAATADLTGARTRVIANLAGPDQDLTVYQVELLFDGSDDIVSAVGGALPDGDPALVFFTDDPAGLYNAPAPGDDDLWTSTTDPLDSFVTLDFDPSTVRTPDFLAEIGGAVAGQSFSVVNSGYFVPGGTPVGADGVFVVAQFVVRDGYSVTYSGVVGWFDGTTGGLVPFLAESQFDCNLNGIGDTDEIASGDAQDCNGNGIPDFCDIIFNGEPDCNANGVPDVCDPGRTCDTDFNDDCSVGFADLNQVLADWGPCNDLAPCETDIDGDGNVGFTDLNAVLGAWGSC